MIISDEYKFVFVHIPKCAGTSVRNCLEKYGRTDPKFSGIASHPELGKIDMTHIPLSVLRKHFIDEFDKIKTYDSFAVVRDPFDRFPSSFFQRLKMFSEVPVEAMTKKEFAKTVDETMAKLRNLQADAVLPYDYIHFQKQQTYIFYDNAQIVGSLFPLESVSDLFKHASRLIGADVGPTADAGASHDNKSEFFRTDFLSSIAVHVLPFYTRTMKKWLPGNLKRALNSLLIVNQSQRIKDVFESTHVRQFVRDYYSEDIELFDRLRSQHAALRQGPRP
ncbi:MAG: sulfotransferase family protein [Gammaproteobacteria bacterium]|nr:sulfotransferase family protein [Gammaproteobacteria bacterium]